MRTKLELIAILLVLFICAVYLIWSIIFITNDYMFKNIVYKSNNFVLERMQKGKKDSTVLVYANGWNISVDAKDKVYLHDPIATLPKAEIKLLASEGKEKYEILFGFYPFEASGLNDPSIELAKFLNENYAGRKIILLGHSKSAVHFANAAKWLDANGSDCKTILISPPFGGVNSDDVNLGKLNKLQSFLYRRFIVKHKVNDDITKGSYFLENIADFSGLSSREVYLIRSKVSSEDKSLINQFFVFLDSKLEIEGDGMIGYEEQKCPYDCKEISIIANHQSASQVAIKELIKRKIL